VVQAETSPMSGDQGGLLWNIRQEDDVDELSIFAGHTRFVSSRRGTDSSPGTTSPSLFIQSEQSPPHDSSSQSIKPQQHQHQVPRPHPGPLLSQHPSATLPRAPSSNATSNRRSPLSRTSSFCGSYMAPPMDPLHYSASEQTRQHSPSDIPSSSPYRRSNDELQRQLYHPLRAQQQTSTSVHHLQPPASFTPSSSSFLSPPPLDSTLQAPHEQQPEKDSPPQYVQQPLRQHQPFHNHAPPTSLQHVYPHTHYSSQHLPPAIHQLSCHLPDQDSHQRYRVDTNPQTTGSHTFPLSGATPSMDLADMGFTPRISRVDERWGSFMPDSGSLEEFRQCYGLDAIKIYTPL
jgi:hypothetical protein